MPRLATQIRLDELLYEKVKVLAEREYRTMNAQMEYFIARSVEQHERDFGAIRLSDDFQKRLRDEE